MIPKGFNSLCVSFLILVLSTDYGASLIITGQSKEIQSSILTGLHEILYNCILINLLFADSSNNLNMVKISYSDAIGSHTIMEGDIVGPMPKLGRSGIVDPNSRWPSNTVVYEYDPNFRKFSIPTKR